MSATSLALADRARLRAPIGDSLRQSLPPVAPAHPSSNAECRGARMCWAWLSQYRIRYKAASNRRLPLPRPTAPRARHPALTCRKPSGPRQQQEAKAFLHCSSEENVPRAEHQNCEHYKGEKQTPEDLLARDLHFAWLKYSIGIL